MIKDVVACTPEEKRRLSEHLETSNVYYYAPHVKDGRIPAFTGFIKSLSDLGSLPSFFHKRDWGVDEPCTFLVGEVAPLMMGPRCPDPTFMPKVREFMDTIESGKMEFIVTIEKKNNCLMVVDGNKRTIAYFELMKQMGKENINYQIYLLQLQ